MLWFSLHLPHLALDLYRHEYGGVTTPLVVYDRAGGRRRVHARNRAAARRGIQPGMALGAAQALCGDLLVCPRDEVAEAECLTRIAAQAMHFTPSVSLRPPDGVLLELAGSCALFGGADALREQIVRELCGLGYHVHLATAPTPEGARLLSRVRHQQPVTELAALRTVLGRLPPGVLEQPRDILWALDKLGLRTVDDCLRLPRAGLTQRVGPDFLAYLDRLLGRLPDPQPLFQPPDCFQARLPLPSEATASGALLFVIQRLLAELCLFLRARAAGTREIRLELLGERSAAGELALSLAGASRDPAHLLYLFREKLHGYQLACPVTALEMTVEHLAPFEPVPYALYADTAEQKDIDQLIERLRARLGETAVNGLRAVADHRPERAWCYGEPGAAPPPPVLPLRPVWLLARPAPLEVIAGNPRLDGELNLLLGPERIESGWWDGCDVERDYYIAQNPQHERFWIFRELRHPDCWFLHGLFA